MKRSADDKGSLCLKKARPDEGQTHLDPFDISRSRKATDVYHSGADDEGYVSFDIHMKWDLPPYIRLQGRAQENGNMIAVEVVFIGPCLQHIRDIGLRFENNDTLSISLRGVNVVMKSPSKASPRTLPMELVYSDGFHLRLDAKRVSRNASPTVINFWKARDEDQVEDTQAVTKDTPIHDPDDWFSTPFVAVTDQPDDKASTKNTGGTVSEIQTHSLLSASDSAVRSNEENLLQSPRNEISPTEHDSREPPQIPSRSQSPQLQTKPEPAQRRLYRDIGPQRASSKEHWKATTNVSPDPPVVAEPSNLESGISPLPRLGSLPPDPKLVKKAAKKVRREARRNARNESTEPVDYMESPQEQAEPVVVLERKSVSDEPSGSTPPLRTVTTAPRLTQSRANSISSVQSKSPSEPHGSQPLSVQNFEGATWTPLSQLSFRKVDRIIGVVAFIGPVNTSASSELYRRIGLVDPSILDKDNLEGGFSLMCFAKRAKESLPNPRKGDVMVVRGLILESHGAKLVGSCPSFKNWDWTIFHPEDGTLRSGGPTVGPYSPAPGLTSPENQYCIRLADWWLELAKPNEAGPSSQGTVQQIVLSSYGNARMARVHRLIKDASPNAPPSGYFDCTFEVLSGHENANGPYSLYVTDYTRNESLHPISASWCVPSLSALVFKIEMWNEAAVQGPNMKPHEFYEMKNCRIKESSGGYWEGSFSEVRKLRKLDEDELEGETNLIELLKRKQAWRNESEANDTHKFPHLLIQDGHPDAHFDCTVEIIRVSLKDDNRALIYVTDYTAHSDLSPISAAADWTRGIEHDRILKVALSNEQVKLAGSLREGDFVAIRCMRLKTVAGGTLAGKLGGSERLIYKLDPKNTGNEHCLELLKRKEKWEQAQQRKADKQAVGQKGAGSKGIGNKRSSSAVVKVPDEVIPKAKLRSTLQRVPGTNGLKDISQVHVAHGPMNFLVLARVVDFHPSLEDFVALYCSNCKEDIPDSRRICTECDMDMDDTYARPYYRFCVEIEDDEGTRQVVHAPSSKGRAVGFLENIEPEDLREDEGALERFKAKIRPLLGKLVNCAPEFIEETAGDSSNPGTPYHNILLTKLAGQQELLLWEYTPLL